jgi:hypothetical protein
VEVSAVAVLLWRSADEDPNATQVGVVTGFAGIAARSFGLIFVRRIAAIIFALLALWTAVEVFSS